MVLYENFLRLQPGVRPRITISCTSCSFRLLVGVDAAPIFRDISSGTGIELEHAIILLCRLCLKATLGNLPGSKANSIVFGTKGEHQWSIVIGFGLG